MDEWILTAELARLELDENEARKLAQQAERMRELFLTMSRADTTGAPTEVSNHTNNVRPDHIVPFEQDLTDAASEVEDGFFLIPNVL